MADDSVVIDIKNLGNEFNGNWVHKDLSMQVKKGEIVAIIGGSGVGKTTLLQTILMLRQPTEGEIFIFGQDAVHANEAERNNIRKRWGVMFQGGALFSSLTVLENIIFPMTEYHGLSLSISEEIARLKLSLVGLKQDTASKYPSEISGGMIKRVAIARAIALDPELVFLDEATSGLDPAAASEIDELVLKLRELLGITFLFVTHDIDTMWRVPDKIDFLGEGRVLYSMPMAELCQQKHPLIRDFFGTNRGDRHQQEAVYGE